MRINRFTITGLFGLFNHDIPLNGKDHITIIHAPNGFGKTVILRMISGFFGGSLGVFREHQFDTVTMQISNGATIEVVQVQTDPYDLFESKPRVSNGRRYRILYKIGDQAEEWDPLSDRDRGKLRQEIPPSSVERYIPHLSRVDVRHWRDLDGRMLDLEEVFERYWQHIPARRVAHPEWLVSLRASIHCQLIETQRLMVGRKDGRPSENLFIPAVKNYSENLAQLMGAALANSANLSQSLDRSFPNRLLSRMRAPREPPKEAVLRQRLLELEAKRARLAAVQLLEAGNQAEDISDERFNAPTRRILGEYVADASKKLAVFNDILARIELFVDLINSRFQFKRVYISREEGFKFRDRKGNSLDPESLSSGEQHELVLTYDLIFRTRPNTLILIDEPEISLHIAWQRRFLSDLSQIIDLNPIDVILSTHSPQLIGSKIKYAIQLKGPIDDEHAVA